MNTVLKLNPEEYYFQVVSDFDRKYRMFEFLLNDVILFHVGLTDERVMEITFHDGIANNTFNWEEMKHCMEHGVTIALEDSREIGEQEARDAEDLTRGQEANS